MRRRVFDGHQEGTSFVEVLVVVVVLAVIAGLTSSFVAQSFRQSAKESAAVGLQSDLVGAQHVLLDDMMLAGLALDGVPESLGTFQSVTTGTSSDRVQFIADVDSDGISDLVTYEVADGSLVRSARPRSGGSWDVGTTAALAENVQVFNLAFFDEDRNALTASQVTSGGTGTARYLRVTLEVETPAHGRPVIRSLSGEVTFRG